MMHLGQDDLVQVMGIGAPGEVRTGPDGTPYEWIEGLDGLGNPVGFWKALRRLRRRIQPLLRRAAPLLRQVAPLIPGVGPAASALLRRVSPLVQRALPIARQIAPLVPGGAQALTALTPVLREAGVSGYDGVGELYQAPDGGVYELQGFAEEGPSQGLGQDELMQIMGIGQPDEVRMGPDGNLYQWMEGIDGLGNPVGFWKALRRIGRRLKPFIRKALPVVRQFAHLVPGYGPAISTALTAATPFLKQAGLAGSHGIGALYAASDGTLYQAPLEPREADVRGPGTNEEVQGFGEEEEGAGGMAEEEDLTGIGQDRELDGLSQGYVREDATSSLGAFVQEETPGTRWYTPPAQSPEIFKPLW